MLCMMVNFSSILGHGGWQVSEYAMAHLVEYLDTHLEKANTEQEIKDAITKAYDQVEQE